MNKIKLAILWMFIVSVFTGSGCGGKKNSVEVEHPRRRTIKSTVIAFGRVEPKSDVNISAEVSEKIESLYVDEGDTVHTGDTLVVLNPGRYLAALKGAEAQVRQVKANLKKARENLAHTKALYESGAVSKDALLAAQTEVDVLEAQLQSAEASLKEAQNDLNHTVILSPMDGIVTKIQAKKGEFVVVGTMNNPGSVIMTIAQLTDLQAKVDVDEADVVDLQIGQPAKIELDAFPDTFFSGRVVQISHQAKVQNLGGEESRATFEVKIAIENPSPQIKPGMSVTATITTAVHDSVLAVPLSSIVAYHDTLTGKDREGVFVVEGGIARKKPVKTGISDDKFIEIVEGLTPSDLVVVGPFSVLRTLKDGEKVSVSKKVRGGRRRPFRKRPKQPS